MKASLHSVAGLAVATLSIELLCGLSGTVANRNRLRHRASYHQGHSAEASNQTDAQRGGPHHRIWPDVANRSNTICA